MTYSPLLKTIANLHHSFAVVDNDELSEPAVVIPQQTHSDIALFVSDATTTVYHADALICSRKNIPVGVVTADCVPIFLVDVANKATAAIHAGWKGTYKKIVINVVTKMSENGSKKEDLYAAIGPAIKSCCYNISASRAQLFTKEFGTKSVINTEGIDYIDLQALNREQLLSAGISANHIDIVESCTCCTDSYYSYRGGDKDKRMVNFLYYT